MRSLYLNEESLSKCFWEVIRQHIRTSPEIAISSSEIIETTRQIQSKFPPGVAGSIDRRAVEELIAISRYFSPRRVCEVGTYIGRSAFSIIAGGTRSLVDFSTCDYSFDQFQVPEQAILRDPQRAMIKYFPKTSSTDMFASMISSGCSESIDFFFIDGRLATEDIQLIRRVMTEDAIFVLDDFEGTEKGVINALSLATHFRELILIRPSLPSSVESFGGKTALLVPTSMIRLTRQQILPFPL